MATLFLSQLPVIAVCDCEPGAPIKDFIEELHCVRCPICLLPIECEYSTDQPHAAEILYIHIPTCKKHEELAEDHYASPV